MINSHQKRFPIVWSIGHSDSSGGTGVQADLLTYHDFNVYGCSVITAIMAQNSFANGYSLATERKSVVAQINALDSDLPATVIKLGLLPSSEVLEPVARYLADYEGYVIYDPELIMNQNLLDGVADQFKSSLLPQVDLLIVNTDEASLLTGEPVNSADQMVAMASQLLANGVQSVLITGAQFSNRPGQRVDYWSDGERHLWVIINAETTVNNRGGGSALSAALAAAKALDKPIEESLQLAKAYVTQGIRHAAPVGSGPGSIAHCGLPTQADDWPMIVTSLEDAIG